MPQLDPFDRVFTGCGNLCGYPGFSEHNLGILASQRIVINYKNAEFLHIYLFRCDFR